MIRIVYGTADIAALLGVSNPAVSNLLKRHSDTPAPVCRTTGGRLYWDRAGLAKWQRWYASRKKSA